MKKLEKSLERKNEYVLKGASEALKEHLNKYPSYEDIRKEHNEYWGIPFP